MSMNFSLLLLGALPLGTALQEVGCPFSCRKDSRRIRDLEAEVASMHGIRRDLDRKLANEQKRTERLEDTICRARMFSTQSELRMLCSSKEIEFTQP